MGAQTFFQCQIFFRLLLHLSTDKKRMSQLGRCRLAKEHNPEGRRLRGFSVFTGNSALFR